MNRLNMTDTRCAALFASGLQPSDAPTGDAVAKAVQRTVRQFGVGGCEGRMAQEFGDHPEAAVIPHAVGPPTGPRDAGRLRQPGVARQPARCLTT